MEWQFIVALVVAIPIILFPVAFIWYLNIKGMYYEVARYTREQQMRKAESQRKAKALRLAGTAWEYIDAYIDSSKGSTDPDNKAAKGI